MNLLHLEYFYTVAKEGGFTKASQALRIQQPAISRMVKQLEDYFGFSLFEKIGRNVRLTSQGQEVFENCKRIFSEVQTLKQSIGKISGTCKGTLAIGCAEPIASHLVPSLTETLIRRHPLIHPNVFSGPAAMMFEKIISGEIEIGMFFHTPALTDKLEVEKNWPLPFRLVVKKELRKNPQVLASFIGSREIDDIQNRRFPTLDLLKKHVPAAKITLSSNNLTAHKEFVLRGMGVSVLPEFLIQKELKSKELVDVLPNEEFRFNLKVIKRKNSALSLNAQELIKLIG